MHMEVNRFSLGMQLDANKEVGDSKIREVSQVISALSQNHFSNEIATSIYSSMNKSITNAIKNFFGEESTNPELVNIIRDTVKKQMLKSMERTSIEDLGTSIARVVGDRFPISSQTFFKSFVKQMLVIMNDEFNINIYSGMGVILVPTEGFVKVVEVVNPKNTKIVKTYSDLLKESTAWKKESFLSTYLGSNPTHKDSIDSLKKALDKTYGNVANFSSEKVLSILLSSNLLKIEC